MGRVAEGWKLWRDPRTGRYAVRFRHDGTRHALALGTTDPVVAAGKAPGAYADFISGRYRPRPRAGAGPEPLDVLVALWLDDYRAGRPGGTADACALHWRAHLLDAFGNDLSRVTSPAIADYQRARLRRVKRKTVGKEMSTLRVFLRWLVDTGRLAPEHAPEIPAMPRGALGVEHKQGRGGERPELSLDDVARLLEALPLTTPARRTGSEGWCRPYVELLYETALRPATVAALRCPDHWRPGETYLTLPAELDKARMARRVPLTPRACELLALARARLPGGAGVLFGARDVRAALESACRAAGVPQIQPYDLRRARATHLLDAGAALGGVGYLLGHARVTTTALYAKGSRRAAEDALRLLPSGCKRDAPEGPKRRAKGGT